MGASVKESRLGLAFVLVLLCTTVIIQPTLAFAGDEPEASGPATNGESAANPDGSAGADALTPQNTPTINDYRIDLNNGELTFGTTPRFNQDNVSENLKALNFGDYGLSEGSDFTILGFEKNEGGSPSLNPNDRTTETPSTSGNYFIIIEGRETSRDSFEAETNIYGYKGIGYAAFSIEVTGHTPGTDEPVLGLNINIRPNGPTGLIWTGQPQAPSITVDQYKGRDLVEGTDYTLLYQNVETGVSSPDKPSEVGEYLIIAKGIGSVKGETRFRFGIYGDKSLANRELFGFGLNSTIYDYTGKAVKLIPAVRYKGSPLVQDVDFALSYENAQGIALSEAPSAEGKYYAVVSGLSPYSGTRKLPFTIIASTSLSHPDCHVRTDRQTYAAPVNAAEIAPKITITFNNFILQENKDYFIAGYERKVDGGTAESEFQPADTLNQPGTYRAIIKAVDGGPYTGSTYVGFTVVEGDNNPRYWISAFEGQNPEHPVTPVTRPTNNSATLPKIVISAPSGAILKEGSDYRLEYYNQNSPTATPINDFTAEGQYYVSAKQIGGNGRNGMHSFYIAAEEHDLTAASVTLSSSRFSHEDSVSLKSKLTNAIRVVASDGTVLQAGRDYNVSIGNKPDKVGLHTVTISGKTSQGYYGTVTREYIIWSPSAPEADTRYDTTTGVTVKGDIIASRQTASDTASIGLEVTKPTGDSLEPEAKKAEDAARAAGAKSIQTYDVTLPYSEESEAGTTTRNLTSGLGITLTFPVDPKYNGMTATITQIHNGAVISTQTAPIKNDGVSVHTDWLSQFVVAVNASPSATEGSNASGNANGANNTVANNDTGNNPSSAGTTVDDGKTIASSDINKTSGTNSNAATRAASPATGDAIPQALVAIIAMAAIASLAALFASRKRSRR